MNSPYGKHLANASNYNNYTVELFQKYSDNNTWKLDILSISETGLKGIKEVLCNITGNNVFAKLKNS